MQLHQSLLTVNWNLIFSIVTLLLLILILRHFFFEKVHRFMEKRKQAVADSLEEAAAKNREAEEKLRQYEKQLKGAEAEKKEILHAAVLEAKDRSAAILEQAKAEAERTRADNLARIDRDNRIAKRELEAHIGDLAVEAAQKILEKEINPSLHRDTVQNLMQGQKADNK